MASRAATLTQAVVDAINAAEITDCPTAERVLVSRYDTTETRDFQVDVMVGEDRTFTPQTRDSWTDSPSVDVEVYRKLPAAVNKTASIGNQEGDRILALAEAIADWLTDQPEIGGYRLLAITFVPVLDRETLRTKSVGATTINLTFSSL